MNRIQHVGFARAITTHQTDNGCIEGKVYLCMIFKIEKPEVIEKHVIWNKIQL